MVSSRAKSPIVSRSKWGAKPWRRKRPTVPLRERRFFVVHYHGGPVSQQYGVAVPRNVERIHLDNGWSGVGYNFVVDQAGVIYEGHGWYLRGAHSPPHNRDGIGVYVAVGGNQKPTAAALRSVRWLYDEQRRLTGRAPIMWWHGRDFSTACPGPHLIEWIREGMPITDSSTTPTTTTSPGGAMTVEVVKQGMHDFFHEMTKTRQAGEGGKLGRQYRDAYLAGAAAANARLLGTQLGNSGPTVAVAMQSGYRHARDAAAASAGNAGTIAGLVKAIEQLSAGRDVDVSAIRQAAHESASAAAGEALAEIDESLVGALAIFTTADLDGEGGGR